MQYHVVCLCLSTLHAIINTDTAMQTCCFGKISDHVPCICVRVIFLHALQGGPFRAGITPSDVHTAQHGHCPALYASLLHAGKHDPFSCEWVESFNEGGLAPYQVRAAVQRHQTHPILCREEWHGYNWLSIRAFIFEYRFIEV